MHFLSFFSYFILSSTLKLFCTYFLLFLSFPLTFPKFFNSFCTFLPSALLSFLPSTLSLSSFHSYFLLSSLLCNPSSQVENRHVTNYNCILTLSLPVTFWMLIKTLVGPFMNLSFFNEQLSPPLVALKRFYHKDVYRNVALTSIVKQFCARTYFDISSYIQHLHLFTSGAQTLFPWACVWPLELKPCGTRCSADTFMTSWVAGPHYVKQPSDTTAAHPSISTHLLHFKGNSLFSPQPLFPVL